MATFGKGERVFLDDDSQNFASVTKTSFLGLSKSTIVLNDEGRLHALSGNIFDHNVVHVSSGKSNDSTEHEIPSTDVKLIGPQILSEEGIDQISQIALFQKFMALPVEERLEKASSWASASDDIENRSVYLQELLKILEDDSAFIRKQAVIFLSHVDDNLKALMFQKLFSFTDVEFRKQLIVRFTLVQNNKRKSEIFIQDLYKLLLDDETYIKIEFNRFGKNTYTPSILSQKINDFIEEKTPDEIKEIAEHWRNRRYYSSRTAKLYVKKILSKY